MNQEELYKYFNYNFGTTCIVHATNEENFFRTLEKRKILRTSTNESSNKRRIGQFERLLGLDDCVWFSLGFGYNAVWDDPFGFIFDINEVDTTFEVFQVHIMLHIHKILIRYWRDHDPQYLKEVMNSNNKVEIVVQEFLQADNLKDGILRFWEIRDILYHFFNRYKNKGIILDLMIKDKKKYKINWFVGSYLRRLYKISSLKNVEIVAHRDIKLDNKNLIGFYIKDGHINHTVIQCITDFMKKFRQPTSEKLVIFNGKEKLSIDSSKI